MKANALLLVLYFVNIAVPGFCQQEKEPISFYIGPQVAGEWTFSKSYPGEQLPSYVTSIVPKAAPYIGAKLSVDVPKGKTFSLGYGVSHLSYGASYNGGEDSAGIRHTGSITTGLPIRRFTLSFKNNVKTLYIYRKREHRQLLETFKFIDKHFKYFAVINFGYFFGVNYEQIPDYSEGYVGIFNSPIQLEDDETVLNRNAVTLLGGINVEFVKNGNKKFELGILYSQGLGKRVEVDWISIIDDTRNHAFSVFSRGSMLSLYAGIPIKIISIKRK